MLLSKICSILVKPGGDVSQIMINMSRNFGRKISIKTQVIGVGGWGMSEAAPFNDMNDKEIIMKTEIVLCF